MNLGATLRWLMDNRDLDKNEKLVALALLSHVNGRRDDYRVWPSLKGLADETGLNRKRTVAPTITRLIDRGLIEDTGERRGQTGSVRVLKLRFAESDAAGHKSDPLPAPEAGHKSDRRGSQNSTGKRVTKVTPELSNRERSKEQRESAPRERATRLTLSTLPDEWREDCRELRPDIDPDATFAMFRDHWTAEPGAAGTSLDWRAKWRNWVRRERGGHGAPAHPFAAGGPMPVDATALEAWARRNGLPPARRGESGPAYRQRLDSLMNPRTAIQRAEAAFFREYGHQDAAHETPVAIESGRKR